MSGFFAKFIVLLEIITNQKYIFITKILVITKIYFHHKNTCNHNLNDINSYLFIIYLTSNVL